MSARALADTLGLHINTVYGAAARGELPSIRVGRRILFDPDAVAAAITNTKDSNA